MVAQPLVESGEQGSGGRVRIVGVGVGTCCACAQGTVGTRPCSGCVQRCRVPDVLSVSHEGERLVHERPCAVCIAVPERYLGEGGSASRGRLAASIFLGVRTAECRCGIRVTATGRQCGGGLGEGNGGSALGFGAQPYLDRA